MDKIDLKQEIEFAQISGYNFNFGLDKSGFPHWLIDSRFFFADSAYIAQCTILYRR